MSASSPAIAGPAAGSPSARRVTAIVGVLSLAVFMSSLDLFIVNLAFPYIGREYSGTSLSSLSWVLNGYTIVFAAVLVPAGRWADRIGRRRIFVVGLAAFSAGSLLCGVASGVAALIAARIVQAAGAGLMVPASLSLLLACVPGPARARAIGTWSALGALGAALGLAARLGGPGRVAVIGCAVNAAAQLLWLTQIQAHPAYLTHLLPAQLLGGAGVGLTIPSLLGAGSTALSPARFGTGSGILNMARQVGTVLGVASLVAVLAHVAPTDPVPAYRQSLILIIAFFAAAAIVSAGLLTGRPRSTQQTSVPVRQATAPVPVTLEAGL
jgi:hypothetical protein